jgi:hypothetical protein
MAGDYFWPSRSVPEQDSADSSGLANVIFRLMRRIAGERFAYPCQYGAHACMAVLGATELQSR